MDDYTLCTFTHLLGRPSDPTNISSTPLTPHSSRLSWMSPDVAALHLLSYLVEVRDVGGVMPTIYNITVTGLQTDINLPNSCDVFEALVIPRCQNAIGLGNSSAIELVGGK